MSDQTDRPTAKQGQYIGFIHYYTKINGRPPSQKDIQRYFQVTPPTVHQMLLRLEEAGFIERTPKSARSLRVLLDPQEIPHLD